MRLDHKLQRVQVDSFEILDELVYRYFDSLPENEREKALLRAIRIGESSGTGSSPLKSEPMYLSP